MDSFHGKLTPFEKMSATNNGRNNPVHHRTLRDKLRLNRAGSAWTSSVHIPTSDVNVHSSRTRSLHCGPHRSNSSDTSHAEDRGELIRASDRPVANSKMQLERRESVSHTNHDEPVNATMPSDAPPSRRIKTQMVQHPSVQIFTVKTDEDDDDDGSDDVYRSLGAENGSESPVEALGEERSISAREVVVAQEAAEATAKEAEEPVKMLLMDLLGETGYLMGEDDEENEEEEEEEEGYVVVSSSGGMEYTCCVCMVRHKGSTFIPCAHTFCRLCSRELMFQRGNCPLCKGYMLEILDIF
ncbi:hypothetical protein V6N13_007915 [Hibiscus sabdariffa]